MYSDIISVSGWCYITTQYWMVCIIFRGLTNFRFTPWYVYTTFLSISSLHYLHTIVWTVMKILSYFMSWAWSILQRVFFSIIHWLHMFQFIRFLHMSIVSDSARSWLMPGINTKTSIQVAEKLWGLRVTIGSNLILCLWGLEMVKTVFCLHQKILALFFWNRRTFSVNFTTARQVFSYILFCFLEGQSKH